jgi:formylglycine-generating enzyme required for sulfatase activity
MSRCASCSAEIPVGASACPQCRAPAAAAGSLRIADRLENVMVGSILADRYEMVREIGAGGMGVVWLAQDRVRDEPVAIKLLPKAVAHDPVAMVGIKREANLSLRITHPNILRLLNLELAPFPFLLMEYVEGRSLQAFLAERMEKSTEVVGHLEPGEVARLLPGLADGLDYAHRAGIIHRDIKPANILVIGTLENPTAKITDFGIAAQLRDTATHLTQTGTAGTPVYMAPEQLKRKRIDRRVDIYALGVTLYQLLAGMLPFVTEFQIHNDPVPEVEWISLPIYEVLVRALAREPGDRYPTAGDLARDFGNAVERGERPAARSAASPGRDAATAPPAPPVAAPPAGSQAAPTAPGPQQPYVAQQQPGPYSSQPPAPYPAGASAPGYPLPPGHAPAAYPAGPYGGQPGAYYPGQPGPPPPGYGPPGAYAPPAPPGYGAPPPGYPQQNPYGVPYGASPGPYGAPPGAPYPAPSQPGYPAHPGAYTGQTVGYGPQQPPQQQAGAPPGYGGGAQAAPAAPPPGALQPGAGYAGPPASGGAQPAGAAAAPAVAEPWPGPVPVPAAAGAGAAAPVAPAAPAPADVPTLPKGFTFMSVNEQGQRLYQCEKDSAPMVLVPAGSFTMGSADGGEDERPPHPVKLSGFLIDAAPVSNRMFQAFVEQAGHKTDAEREGKGWAFDGKRFTFMVKGADWKHPNGPTSGIEGRDDAPVLQVSWNDAQAYASWAGKQLPTEAQWEYAARGGTSGARYPWGDEDPADRACFNFASGGGPKDVGSFKPNAFGLYDMAGNVWEWCADWYAPTYYKESSSGDPPGPAAGNTKVLRGGTWHGTAVQLRCSYRFRSDPNQRNNSSGFRCALPLKGLG